MELILNYVGKDGFNRPVYKNGDKLFVDVCPCKGKQPDICTVSNNVFGGEPDTPIEVIKKYENVEIQFVPHRVLWGMKTIEDVEKLKRDWLHDPCYDIYDANGFEVYREELKAFQEKCEEEWNEKRKKKELEIDEKAEELGTKGIYRIVMKHQELLERQNRAIEALTDGDNLLAYNILMDLTL